MDTEIKLGSRGVEAVPLEAPNQAEVVKEASLRVEQAARLERAGEKVSGELGQTRGRAEELRATLEADRTTLTEAGKVWMEASRNATDLRRKEAELGARERMLAGNILGVVQRQIDNLENEERTRLADLDRVHAENLSKIRGEKDGAVREIYQTRVDQFSQLKAGLDEDTRRYAAATRISEDKGAKEALRVLGYTEVVEGVEETKVEAGGARADKIEEYRGVGQQIKTERDGINEKYDASTAQEKMDLDAKRDGVRGDIRMRRERLEGELTKFREELKGVQDERARVVEAIPAAEADEKKARESFEKLDSRVAVNSEILATLDKVVEASEEVLSRIAEKVVKIEEMGADVMPRLEAVAGFIAARTGSLMIETAQSAGKIVEAANSARDVMDGFVRKVSDIIEEARTAEEKAIEETLIETGNFVRGEDGELEAKPARGLKDILYPKDVSGVLEEARRSLLEAETVFGEENASLDGWREEQLNKIGEEEAAAVGELKRRSEEAYAKLESARMTVKELSGAGTELFGATPQPNTPQQVGWQRIAKTVGGVLSGIFRRVTGR